MISVPSESERVAFGVKCVCVLMMSRGSVVVCDSEQWTPLISHCSDESERLEREIVDLISTISNIVTN
jgi:hypothetical protein